MSLHQLAQQIQASGRGNDTQLVHMAPAEVRSLRKLAQHHGGDLTVNPRTGLPEAGFLENLLPTVVGAGVGIMTGNPFIGAAAGGALGMAANKGSIQSGLMAGLGAYGMGSLGAGLMEAGAGAAGDALVANAGPGLTAEQLAANTDAALTNVGANAGQTTAQAATAFDAANPTAALTPVEKLRAGIKNTTFNADFFKKNLMPISAAAAPLLMSGSGGNLFGGNEAPKQDGANQGYIRPYTYRQTRNPGYTGAGTPFFTQSMTPGTPVAASDFGATYMADGGLASLSAANPAPGIVVYDPVSGRYNQQAADTVPMTPVAAPTAGGMMPMQYDPSAQRYVTPPPPPAPMAAADAPPIDYFYGNDGGVDGSGNSDNAGTSSGNEGGGAEGAGGDSDGFAYGGLMQAYAMGGGIGNSYDGTPRFNNGPQYPMQQPQNFAYGGGIANLGGYSDGGRLLRGPGDGVSDDIPAQIGDKQPARLADGEFVVPARIVSELGNGSTDAGAKRLYAMMDRVQQNRKKSVGKDRVAVDSKAYRHLPA